MEGHFYASTSTQKARVSRTNFNSRALQSCALAATIHHRHHHHHVRPNERSDRNSKFIAAEKQESNPGKPRKPTSISLGNIVTKKHEHEHEHEHDTICNRQLHNTRLCPLRFWPVGSVRYNNYITETSSLLCSFCNAIGDRNSKDTI
jgi:hypothetical protein